MSFMPIVVLHNGKQHGIEIPESPDITVGDLMDKIASEVHIPPPKQRLIHRGRSLIDPDASITSCKIKPGAKIMLIGNVEVTDPVEIRKLDELELTLDSETKNLDAAEATCSKLNVSKNESEARNLVKKILGITELCTKALEKADSVYLPTDDTKQRTRRKALVNTFNELISKAEKLQAKAEALCTAPAIVDINK